MFDKPIVSSTQVKFQLVQTTENRAQKHFHVWWRWAGLESLSQTRRDTSFVLMGADGQAKTASRWKQAHIIFSFKSASSIKPPDCLGIAPSKHLKKRSPYGGEPVDISPIKGFIKVWKSSERWTKCRHLALLRALGRGRRSDSGWFLSEAS